MEREGWVRRRSDLSCLGGGRVGVLSGKAMARCRKGVADVKEKKNEKGK